MGLQIEILNQETFVKVESYLVTSYEKEPKTFEKMNLQNVVTNLVTKEITLPIGSYKISTNQKNAALLYETLEPEASSSFVSMGVLETELNKEIPIYRHFKNIIN